MNPSAPLHLRRQSLAANLLSAFHSVAIVTFLAVLGLPRLSAVTDVHLHLESQSGLPVINPLLFGLFEEEHWGDLVPAVWEQYIVNPSFEDWYISPDSSKSKPKTREVFIGNPSPSTPVENATIGHPWEATGNATWSRDTGTFKNTKKSQKIHVAQSQTGGVFQKVAIPNQASRTYQLRFFAKKSGNVTVNVTLKDGNGSTVSGPHAVTIPTSWGTTPASALTQNFTLGGSANPLPTMQPSPSPFGVAKVYIEATGGTGGGDLWLDQVTLIPTDAVEFAQGNAYNPETIALLRDIVKPKFLRWPGGNFSSIYHWRDGINNSADGINSRDDRPTRPNIAYGGVVPNEMGTDEFLHFCELIGAAPVMGCASNGGDPSSNSNDSTYVVMSYWNSPYSIGTTNPYDSASFYHVTPTELGDWVEYCNGPSNSTWGAKRVANGHSASYAVQYWGVGNEVYGTYQFGNNNLDVATYITLLKSRAQTMKGRDSSGLNIKIVASGLGVHNTYRQQDANWTSGILASNDLCKSGQVITGVPLVDYLDLHSYVYGDNSTPADYNDAVRAVLGSTQFLESYYDTIRTLRSQYSPVRPQQIFHTEWAVQSKDDWSGSPTEETWAGALAMAAHYNAYIRNADLVQAGGLHNFSLNFQPVLKHSAPPYPVSDVLRLYQKRLAVEVTTDATYSTTTTYPEIGLLSTAPAVNDVDAVAAISAQGETVDVILINRHRTSTRSVNIHAKHFEETGWKVTGDSRKWTYAKVSDAFAKQLWNGSDTTDFVVPTYAISSPSSIGSDNPSVSITMDPLSLVHLRLDIRTDAGSNVIKDNSDGSGIIVTGSWSTPTSPTNLYGNNFRTITSAGSGANKVRWTPTLPAAGNYQVYYWVPDGDGTCAINAPIRIHWTGDGSSMDQTYQVDQTVEGGQWVYLATKNFTTTAGYVEITDGSGTSGKKIVADAIRFYKP